MESNVISSPGVVDAEPVGPYKVDTSRGTTHSRVSSQFWNRPDDQRFLSLDELSRFTHTQAEQSFPALVDVRDIKVTARRDDSESLRVVVPDRERDFETEPTHWSFGQLCSLVSVPAGYLRKLPAPIAGINLQYGLSNFRQESIKAYVRENGRTELRAATGPEYGRVCDHEVVDAVRRIAGNGTGDTRWKVPGVLNWRDGTYNPYAPITKESTTLFASDRDVFMFLVDDRHPIEIGKLPDGSPDLIFRGFYVWNSEVGSKTLGVATMYLRGVCQNRMLWGVEGFQEITLRHSKNAPMRFAGEVAPALESFSEQATGRLLTGVQDAKARIVARTDDARSDFLAKQGFTKPESSRIIASVVAEEGHEPESVWDFVQGITATARTITHQDDRVAMERRAGKLLDKVAA